MSERFTDTEKRELDRENRLFGYQGWIKYSGYEICAGQVWNIPGIYVIYLDGAIAYIGQSNTIRFRFSQHGFKELGGEFLTPWGCFKDLRVKIKFPKKYGEEAMIEKRLIRRLRPRFNVYFNRVIKMPVY